MSPLDTARTEPLAATPASALRLAPARACDGAAVDALMRRAFGPGHYAKVSERLREGNRLRADLSLCAFLGDDLAGAVRLWPVRANGAPFLFLGPIGVEASLRHHGLGGKLIDAACEAATAAGDPLIALVGARALFEPHGFTVVPEGRLTLPGPVDYRRFFWRPLRDGGEGGLEGLLRIAPDLGLDPA